MVDPKEVHPQRYKEVTVIYDGGPNNGLAIAELEDFDGTRYYGLRWNGNNVKNNGYPLQGANPLWFDLPDCIQLEDLKPIIHKLECKKNPN